jgi:hypothetical protein
MTDWTAVIVAFIAAVTALAGYLITGRLNRIDRKARYYADALGAVERYKQLPFTIYRRHDSTSQTRAELSSMIGETQANLSFYRGLLELDSPKVGIAYGNLVDKIRERNSTYRRQAFQGAPCTDADVEEIRTSVDFVYHSYQVKRACIQAMRDELRIVPRSWMKRKKYTVQPETEPLD